MRAYLSCLIGVSVSGLSIPHVAAQDIPAGASAGDASEIIVQARRRDESVQDVPLVVNAVTAESIEKLNLREFKDIQALVPGLNLNASANGIGTQSTLRGMAFDVNASGNNGTIEFYLNDAPVSANVLYQSMFDVGQIEVLRGPQGTLRGRASPSGSITVSTRRPDLNEVGGYALGTLNTLGGVNINGAMNVPVIAGRLAVRIAGIVDENDDNEVRSVNSAIRPSSRTQGLRASVQANPIDPLTLNFSYTHTDKRVESFYQVESANIIDPALPAGPRAITASDRLATGVMPRTYRQNFEVYNWQAELNLLGQKLNYVGAAAEQNYNTVVPNDLGGFFSPAFPASVLDASSETFTAGKQRAHELRLSSDERLLGIFDYVVGHLWNRLRSPSNVTSNSLIFSGPPTPTNLTRLVVVPVVRQNATKETSIFANVTAHLDDRTEVSGGIRRIKYHSEGSLFITGPGFVPAANEDRTLRATIYSASAKHRFNDNLMTYASFGTSWRPGSATNPVLLRDIITPTPALAALYYPDAEKSKSYEIGVKSDFFDRRLRLNLTAYRQTFDNFAYYARELIFGGLDATGVNRVFADKNLVVGVPAEVTGVEAEIQFRATDAWNMSAVFAYADSKISGTIPCNDLNGDGQPDASFTVPDFPTFQAATGGNLVSFCDVNQRAGIGAPFSATLQSEYTHPLSDTMDGYVRGLLRYDGNSQNDPTNPIDDIKAYGLLNLFAGLRDRDGGWEITGYVKNALNTMRVTQRNSAIYTAPYRVGATAVNGETTYRGITYTPPREFGISARVAIGSR